MRRKGSRSPKKLIAFSGTAAQEVVNRRLAGVIRYVEEHEASVAVRDFRYEVQFGDVEHRGPPPWTGIVDGVIICFGVQGSAEAMGRWLLEGGVPVVSLVREWSHPGIPIVDIDTAATMKMAADYFVERGFRNFAFVGDGFSLHDTPARRKRFEARLAEHRFTALGCDLTFRPNGNVDDLDYAVQQKELIRLLKEAPKPLALFTLNDSFARVICLLCERMKIDVPGEVAILGSGNFTTSRCQSPTLSTIVTASEQIGYEAARLLYNIICGGPIPSRPKLLPPLKIIERESTTLELQHRDEMAAAHDYIRQYACSGIKVEDIVRMLAISRRSFETRFVDRFGKAPKRMIQEVRLERTLQLLKQSQLSITQVALMTGFSDVAGFTNFVRRETGASPTQLREQASL